MPRRPHRALLSLEALEGRCLLDASLYPGVHTPGSPDTPGSPLLDAHIAVIPNDASFSYQDHLHNVGQRGGVFDADIDAAEAWDIATGTGNTIVAIIDTGIDYRHKDLYRNIWINQGEIPSSVRAQLQDLDGDGRITFWDLNNPVNQGVGKARDLNGNGRIDGGDLIQTYRADGTGGWANGVSEDGDQYIDDVIGWNFVADTNNPLDDNDHGTHVAGILGATGNDGVGVTGVMWRVQLMALKFLNSSGSGSTLDAAEAVRYAVAKGARVSNHSWGSTALSVPLRDAIADARLAGHVVVAAAGNGGSDYKGDDIDVQPFYPASFDLSNVVAVGAVTRNDRFLLSSNYGDQSVHLFAPGYQVYSTTRNDGYKYLTGTSMATPQVTAAVALTWEQHANWAYYQVVDQVLRTVDTLTALQGKAITGGRLNLNRALSETPVDVTGPRVVVATPSDTGSKPVGRVRLTFDEAIDPASFTPGDIILTGPSGSIIVTSIAPVAGTDDRTFDVVFNQQTTAGSYQLTVGPDVRDRTGNRMDQDGDGIAGELSGDRFSATFVIEPTFVYANSTQLSIPDNASVFSTVTVDRDFSIADLNVRLNVTHTFDNDLYLHLKGPDGTDVSLSMRRGGAGDNFSNTIFDDEAAKHIREGAAPFAGSFRPESPLAAFNGKNARGVWQLWIEDRARADVGRLNSWSLTFESSGSGSSSAMAVAMPVEGTAAEKSAVRMILTQTGAGLSGVESVSVASLEIPLPLVQSSAESPTPARSVQPRVVLQPTITLEAPAVGSGNGSDLTFGVDYAEADDGEQNEPDLEQLMRFFER